MLRGFNGNCQIKGAIHHELISQVEGRELVDGNLEGGRVHPATVDSQDVGDSEFAQFPKPFARARS